METLPTFVPVITYSRSLVVHLMSDHPDTLLDRLITAVWRTYGYTLCGRWAGFGRTLPGLAGDANCPVCRLKAGVGRLTPVTRQ
jgi:hypothetical protein